MSPHPDHFHGAFSFENLVHEAMLYVDPPRKGARKIADELLEGGRVSEGVLSEKVEKELCLLLETRVRELARVPVRLAGENDPPAFHQFNSSTHSERGVLRPFRIDARMPGIDSRWSVS